MLESFDKESFSRIMDQKQMIKSNTEAFQLVLLEVFLGRSLKFMYEEDVV